MHSRRPESQSGVILWLALAVCLAYANALNGSFQFDDYNVIVNYEHVHSWASWFAGLSGGIRPLLKLSYTLNWTMDIGVAGFHFTNLLIHWVNAILVYQLAKAFTRQQWLHDSLRHVPLLAALLFAVHPIHTEAVSYICGRSASLMTLFYLAALLSYVTGRTRDSKFLLNLATPLLFVLALGVKETAITFPLALLLWELGCGGRWQSALKPQGPVWAVSLLAVLFFILSNSYFAQMQRSFEFNSLYGNLATQLSGFAYLLRQWLLPLWLNIDPDLPLLTGVAGALLPLFIFVALFVLMLTVWRSRPWLGFALAWAMLQLIPLYLFLPRIDIANEREMYLAGWPLFLALSIELTLWLNGKVLRVAAAVLLLTFATLTVLRNQVYASEISLWQDTVLKSPNKARVHNNLGHAYLLAQRYDAARSEFTAALQLDPQLYQARYNLLRADEESNPAASAAAVTTNSAAASAD
ncbi:MAG: tetratricopeptide repeat protein [Gammaproteobacteria bacterium]|nr:tetratricopeptide repeat protein [Gammaproteobacteria bacterium]MBU1482950.1 tetratricopeptide repeat protein [Gammaproteobacteria bacterium]